MKTIVPRLLLLASLNFLLLSNRVAAQPQADPFLDGNFHWVASAPLVSPAERSNDPCYSVKDPSVVRFGDRWHVFSTIRSQKRTHQIEYINFDDWPHANAATRHLLTVTNGYFCAPQVFYFTPHKRWYLVYQINDSRLKKLQPAFSTSTNIADPT